MSNFEDLVHHYAKIKFGEDNEDAIANWLRYWTDTLSRNLDLVNAFRSRTEITFSGKTVLDIGCGTGGLSQIVSNEGGYYIGSDFFPAVLEMATAFISDLAHAKRCSVIRASGTSLPLSDRSVDVVVAFDIIEHLEGGWNWQLSLLQEVSRVLRLNGILLLTTPNRLYPFEGHAFLYGPQYLPVWLADRYIRWKNPSFLQEYNSYAHVKLLNPWQMKRLLDLAGLKTIHDFPWGMDLEDHPKRWRLLLQFLGKFGLEWVPTTGFWFSACRKEDWNELRAFRKKKWLRT